MTQFDAIPSLIKAVLNYITYNLLFLLAEVEWYNSLFIIK